MLPFLVKPRPQTGITTEVRPSDYDKKESSGLDVASKDLMESLESKDVKRISAALKAAFQILDSEDEDMSEDESSESKE